MANAKVQGADGGGLQGKISFSVVIPVFNVEPYLGQCLDSMLPALRAEDEIILALRSSEDGSITIAEHYAQENGNIRLLRQDGIGLSNARNCAVREAYGTYLIYVDSDDRVDTAQFTHALQRIREDTSHRDVYFFDFYHDNHRTGKLEPWFQIGEGGNFQGVENIGKILRQLCEWKKVTIVEAEVCSDHIHMLLEIPPKIAVSSFVGYLKGKSSLMIYEQFPNLKYKYRNREFWCRGYYVDTVGKNAKKIEEYIRNQLEEDRMGEQLTMGNF